MFPSLKGQGHDILDIRFFSRSVSPFLRLFFLRHFESSKIPEFKNTDDKIIEAVIKLFARTVGCSLLQGDPDGAAYAGNWEKSFFRRTWPGG
jgi:hypothetical protein